MSQRQLDSATPQRKARTNARAESAYDVYLVVVSELSQVRVDEALLGHGLL
jgi:hypothetical protein